MRDASTAPADANESTEATDPADPIDSSEPADPIEPADPNDPTEPIESTEPSLAIDSTEPREASDHRESMRHTLAMTTWLDRDRLRADCGTCVALCCVAPSFTVSADFAIDKPAGVVCPNLAADDRCTIHERLRESGFPGCAAYDCFGAGQRVATGARTPELFAAFAAMRRRHELLWYLAEAAELADGALHGDALAAADALERDAIAVDDVGRLLDRAAELARGGPPASDRAGADLIGRDLRHIDLRAADLRGAYLIRADLRGVDLALADIRSADLRGADLRGARLEHVLYLTRSQLGAADCDQATTVPHWLRRYER